MTMMRGIYVRHELISAVLRAAFRSTETLFAHEIVFLIGKSLRFDLEP